MKNKQTIFILGMIILLIVTTALSYGYFEVTVGGNANAKDVVVETGTLKLTYTDGPAINTQNIKPGWSTTKTVSVKNNGTLDTNYNIIWQSLTNTIINDELVISATCQRLNSSGVVEGTCESISQAPIKETTISKNISIESGITHKYTFTILFKEINADQNYNQGKEFNGVLGIEEYKEDSSTQLNCVYNGELTQGTEYVNGQYTYYYNQEQYVDLDEGGIKWRKLDNDGWSVQLTNKESTEAVTSSICSNINNKPILSMSFMYDSSQAHNINLDNIYTSNVTNMFAMFSDSQATSLNLSNFDTSKVIDMNNMFSGSQATTLDLSNFDTSKVIDMNNMFSSSQAITLDLSNFDTSNVTNMDYMFSNSTDLKTIYASETFNDNNIQELFDMFSGCTSLVGGAGTTYDEDYIDFTYAHIDGGEGNPGYFTAK